MAIYIFKRLIQSVPTILLVTLFVFLMLHFTPGDPAEIFVGDGRGDPELIERVREEMGLNRPLHEQYFGYLFNAVRGNLGDSLNNGRPVLDEILTRLPSTLELTLAALVISTFLGISLGMVAALKHNTLIDSAAMMVALVGISLPVYWSSLLLIVVFSVNLKWFPPIGQGSLDRLVMPALALGFLSAGSLARLVRSGMLEVLSQDYILTARSKGLRGRTVVLRHALRNSLIPVITVLGLTFGQLLGGAVLTETIFSRLGIGRMYVDAVLNKDFTLVQGTTLFIAVTYVFINIAIDVIYLYVDPRIKYD
jgi:peptide/nickel transport system permease protein